MFFSDQTSNKIFYISHNICTSIECCYKYHRLGINDSIPTHFTIIKIARGVR